MDFDQCVDIIISFSASLMCISVNCLNALGVLAIKTYGKIADCSSRYIAEFDLFHALLQTLVNSAKRMRIVSTCVRELQPGVVVSVGWEEEE